MGPPRDEQDSPAPTGTAALNADELDVELPGHLPHLTPGLAGALMRAIVSAARSAGLIDNADTAESEAIAS